MVKDHYGRKVGPSPYRILLGTGDTWALKQVHKLILPKIENGKAIAQAQFREQFPNFPSEFDPENLTEEAFYDVRNKKMIADVKDQLQIIVAKITADPCKDGLSTLDNTKDTVEALRQIFAPKEDEVITTGLHFPLAIMQEVYYVYSNQVRPWSGDQLAFFSREVIGSTLDASTAVDGQCYKSGLKNLKKIKEKGPDRQDGLFCAHPKGIPAELSPLSNKLGRTVFVDPYDGESYFLPTAKDGLVDWYNKKELQHGPRWAWATRNVGILIQNKSRDLWELLGSQLLENQHTPEQSQNKR